MENKVTVFCELRSGDIYILELFPLHVSIHVIKPGIWLCFFVCACMQMCTCVYNYCNSNG